MIDTELSTDPRVAHLRGQWYQDAKTPREAVLDRLNTLTKS
jgi:hypothetical protein